MKRLASVLATVVLASSVAVTLGQGGGGAAGRGGRGGQGRAGGQGQAQPQGGQGQFPGGGGRGGPGAMGINLNFYTTEYDIMVTTLNLTDDQKPKVKTEADAMNYELNTFEQNAQGQMAGGRGGRGGRGRAGGPDGAANQQALMAKLQDDFQLLADEHQIKINAQLTPEQRVTWETYKLNRILDGRLNPLVLSDDQKEKVKGIVDDTAKAIAALTDGKDLQTLEGRMIRKIVADVLTEPQSSKFVQGPLQLGGRGGGFANGGQFGNNGAGGGQTGGNAAGGGGFGNGGGGRAGRGGGGRGGRGGGAASPPQAGLP